uniref:Uncharacterized protein n=1 Tax=Brugia timori TaxID=42155 RepID=A0A0R3Q832_9BILA
MTFSYVTAEYIHFRKALLFTLFQFKSYHLFPNQLLHKFTVTIFSILILMNQMKCFTMFFINPFLVFRLKKSYSKRRYLKAIWALQLIKVNI